MKTAYACIIALLLAAPVSAQPRPGAFTTLTATTITATAVNTGTVTTTGNVIDGGTLTVNGFGNHVFSAGGTTTNQIIIRNTTAGTSNTAEFVLGNDATSRLGAVQAFSSTFTPVAAFLPSGIGITSVGSGGLVLAVSDAAGTIRFATGNSLTEHARVHASGAMSIGNTTDIGSAGNLNTLTADYVGYDAVNAYGKLSPATMEFFAGPGLPLMRFDASGGAFGNWLTTASAANAHVGNGDYVRLVTSIRAAKHDIESIPLADARRTVLGLRAVLYQSLVDDDQRQWPGLIAEEVAAVNPALAIWDDQGKLQSVAYDRVVEYLIPVLQDQERRLQSLERRRR